MTNGIDKWSYPTPVAGLEGTLFSLAFGAFVTIFLWFFEPFNFSVINYSFSQISVFGLISFFTFLLGHTILPVFIPNLYQEENWTIYSQITFYGLLTFIIATLNGLYVNFLNDLDFSWSNYLLIIIQTVAVGIIPITLYVLLTYVWMYRKIAERSQSINEHLPQQRPPTSQQYTIHSNIKGEAFIIDTTLFLFAKASGNYIEVTNTGTKGKLYRMSLSDLDKQLLETKHIIRCHRSYTVNTKQVTKVTGNAQGLKLWLSDETTFIPVSRNYLEKVKHIFEG